MLSDADLPLVIEGVVRFQSNSGTFPKKEGCLILKVDKRGEYALVVRQNLGKTWEVKVKHMYSNKSYFEQTKDRTKGETKIIVQFKDKGNNASTAYLEDADPAEVKRFCRCLDQAKHRKSSQNRVPTGRIVSQRTSPPMAAQHPDTPTPDLDGLTPSKKRPRSQENQTPNKSLRQAGNTSTPIKQRQATPAKGEQTPSRGHTPLRVPTPRPDSKHTPGRDSSLSRFKREHGGVETETAAHSTGANLRENTKQNDRSPSVPRKGNSGFLESAKKKFEAGDEKRKFSAVSLSTSFYSNPAPKNYTIPKYRPGIMPAPQPRRLHQAENYTGWSDKNKGLVKSQAQPSLQGFSNLGNTCYMNAILQALRGMETFSIDLINREVIRAVEETTLYRNIAALFRYCNKPTEKQEAFRKQQFLKGVKTAVSSSAQRFSGYLQHDAHEFLSQCLDQLKEDVKKVRSDKAKDNGEDKESLSDSSDDHGLPCPVSQNFQFEVIHTISCKSCRDVVTKQEKFHDLSLTLPRRRKDMNPWSLQDLLDQFFISEDLEYTCTRCESKQSRVSHHFIKLPRVLILHLKRYNYNHAMSENRKMEQPVFLPLYLTLQSHCTEETHPCRPPSIPPSFHPPTERRTDTTGDNRNAGTSAKKSFSFRPSKAYERIQMMESSEDESLGNRSVKKESQLPTEEDIELQKAIQLSKETAEAEKFQQSLFLMSSDSDFTSTSDFTLDNVTEEEQLRRALQNSMQESETPVPVTPQPRDMTLMSPCVLTPLNKESNKKPGLAKGPTPNKPSSQKPPPEAKLFSVISEDKNVNGTGGKDASTMLDFFEGEEETFEIKYTEEPQTVGLCGGNDNPRYASPGQVKRRHHSEGGGSKLGLSSSKKKRLSSPGGGGRANKTLPFAKSNGQRTLGKWLRKNCFTSSDVGVKASCGEVQEESHLSDKCDAISGGMKEEKRAPEDNSTEDEELRSFTQLEGVKRRREEKSKPKDESVSTDSSQDEEVQSSTQLKEVKRREEKSKPKVEIESANSSQDSEIESSTQIDEVIIISTTDLEETSESETPQMRTDSPRMATCVWEAVKGSKHESESEQEDFQKKDPKEVSIKTEVVTKIKSEDPDEIVAKFHEKLAEHSSVTVKSEATNEEAPSVVTSHRRASSDNASADPNNNQDLNNNSEADVESESDKENQQPEEEVVGQGSVGQGSVPSLTLPDWVTEHVQQGEQSDRQKEEEDMQRALDESRALQKEREEKEKEELRKVLELSRQEYDQSFEMDPFEEEISEEEDVAMAEFARSMEEAEAIRKNAETGDLPYSYRLVSVVNHIGKKSSSGHYISDVYDMQKRAWLKWDDSHVECTSERYVREKRQTSGYIFFYMNKDCFEDVVAQTRSTDQH
ncbi:USP37 [Branchiostoma lanceolatum]|uniref:USP37 protein n=2 Tax=Branchiostoma lanceolatum TaxID=7740 RepID=A0A8J9Z9X2_BRALA|nr:USP37 [Branchiostoma lanceolatum]